MFYLHPGEFWVLLIPLGSYYYLWVLSKIPNFQLDDEDENLGAADDEDEGGRRDPKSKKSTSSSIPENK